MLGHCHGHVSICVCLKFITKQKYILMKIFELHQKVIEQTSKLVQDSRILLS